MWNAIFKPLAQFSHSETTTCAQVATSRQGETGVQQEGAPKEKNVMIWYSRERERGRSTRGKPLDPHPCDVGEVLLVAFQVELDPEQPSGEQGEGHDNLQEETRPTGCRSRSRLQPLNGPQQRRNCFKGYWLQCPVPCTGNLSEHPEYIATQPDTVYMRQRRKGTQDPVKRAG
jgi:hypothetical protein